MPRLLAVSACALLLLGSAPFPRIPRNPRLELRTIEGRVWRPLEPAGAANVLFFVATDCPVSNAYAPEIQRICAAYQTKGVQCALIYEDAGVTTREVRTHLDEHRYAGVTAAIDGDGSLAARVNATITPEAVAIDRQGAVRYHGRIDNFYAALGRARQVVTEHDLRDALDAMVGGRTVGKPATEPIGCYIVPSNQRSK
jgi:thiol-disulfide isomerase/thioredoxin